MKHWTIYHNPRCSKSRAALAFLQEHGITPEIILYLSDPLNKAQLKKLTKQLGFASARSLLRTQEAAYREFCLDDQNLSEDELIDVIRDNPILIERPIVSNGLRTLIARPPEILLELL